MDADKKARIKRIAGFSCLELALLNATFAVLAMVAEKDVKEGMGGIAMAASLFAIGMVNLTLSKRRRPPGGPGA